MCDFFVFFQSDIEEKNRPNTINIWFGMIVNWSRTSFNFNFTRDEFVYVLSFVKCKGHCSKDWTCLLQIYSLLLSIL